jgi:RNA polymerase sigma-70 factor (ECF subfamily)
MTSNLFDREQGRQTDEHPSIERLNDAEVLTLSLRSPEAFNVIVSRYQRLFVRKALEITGNEDDAYDVVQDTFVRIYAAAKKFKAKNNSSFKSWAYTILVRQCYTLYRKQKRRQTFVVPLDPEFADIIPDESVSRSFEHALSMEGILALITRLPSKLRRVVELHFIEGTSQKEIAISEGLTPVAVRARIHRAKSELRRLHQEMGVY